MALLNRESVIDAAPELLNKTGIDGLTTRKLAFLHGPESLIPGFEVQLTHSGQSPR